MHMNFISINNSYLVSTKVIHHHMYVASVYITYLFIS
jgi:hypothetical protein